MHDCVHYTLEIESTSYLDCHIKNSTATTTTKNVYCVTCRRVGGVAMAVVLKSADNFSCKSKTTIHFTINSTLHKYVKYGIIWVRVVLNRTVVDSYSDNYFDNLCGSHFQSQSELYLFS